MTRKELKDIIIALLWAVEDDLLDYELEHGQDTSYERYLAKHLAEEIGVAL